MYEKFTERARRLVSLNATESTNAVLKEMIKSSEEPVFAAVLADFQTKGRGRLGRDFYSPRGGLYFSVSYPLLGSEKNIPFLTLLAGLAVSEAISELTGTATEIKWPNDIYLNQKKLGGILCELVSAGSLTVVAGIGINLSTEKKDIPEELLDKMTSFAAEGIAVPDKTALFSRITQKLDEYIYEKEELFGVSKKSLDNVRRLSYSIGKNIKYKTQNGVIEGKVCDITENGAVRAILTDGTEKEIFFGEIIQ
ncbi:MAG: biotin--[Clostridia bacterium]|nr:biotin--[acetyl-CoA-carboxylase] ligase [Clostridia bacterium]